MEGLEEMVEGLGAASNHRCRRAAGDEDPLAISSNVTVAAVVAGTCGWKVAVVIGPRCGINVGGGSANTFRHR